jgi:hypothetical protein
MPKPRKKAAVESDAPIMPQVGDKVIPARTEMVYEILHVHHGGGEVDLHVPGMNLERTTPPRGIEVSKFHLSAKRASRIVDHEPPPKSVIGKKERSFRRRRFRGLSPAIQPSVARAA